MTDKNTKRDDVIVMPIKPIVGYAVLRRTGNTLGLEPIIEVVTLWHDGNRPPSLSSPKNAAKTTLNQLRTLNGLPNVSYAIAIVAMPHSEGFA